MCRWDTSRRFQMPRRWGLRAAAEPLSRGTWLTWKGNQALPDVEETAWVFHAKTGQHCVDCAAAYASSQGWKMQAPAHARSLSSISQQPLSFTLHPHAHARAHPHPRAHTVQCRHVTVQQVNAGWDAEQLEGTTVLTANPEDNAAQPLNGPALEQHNSQTHTHTRVKISCHKLRPVKEKPMLQM